MAHWEITTSTPEKSRRRTCVEADYYKHLETGWTEFREADHKAVAAFRDMYLVEVIKRGTVLTDHSH